MAEGALVLAAAFPETGRVGQVRPYLVRGAALHLRITVPTSEIPVTCSAGRPFRARPILLQGACRVPCQTCVSTSASRVSATEAVKAGQSATRARGSSSRSVPGGGQVILLRDSLCSGPGKCLWVKTGPPAGALIA